MSALRVPAGRLWTAAAANAARSPVPAHHRTVYAVRLAEWALSEGERWFLDAVLRLSGLSERQWARLRDIEAKAERARK